MTTSGSTFTPRRGIIERWYSRNGTLLCAPLWVILALAIALPVFNHVGWLIGFIGFGGIALGSVLGGADRSSGSEEYILALPP